MILFFYDLCVEVFNLDDCTGIVTFAECEVALENVGVDQPAAGAGASCSPHPCGGDGTVGS